MARVYERKSRSRNGRGGKSVYYIDFSFNHPETGEVVRRREEIELIAKWLVKKKTLTAEEVKALLQAHVEFGGEQPEIN